MDMDVRHSVLLKILGATKLSFNMGLSVFETEPRCIISSIIDRIGPQGLILTLEASQLKNVSNITIQDIADLRYSDKSIYSVSTGFLSNSVFSNSLEDGGCSYHSGVDSFLDGAKRNSEWSREYLYAELESLERFSPTALFRAGDTLFLEFGIKKIPYRKMTVIEQGFLSPDARAFRKNKEQQTLAMTDLLQTFKDTGRALYFICGDFDLESASEFFKGHGSNFEVIPDSEFEKNISSILRAASLRQSVYVVFSKAFDSISLYAWFQSIEGFDVKQLMSSFGGFWSYQAMPRLCKRCKKITKKLVVNKVEHGISLGGKCADNGGGCSSCLHGYSGLVYVEERISSEHVSRFISSIERFEKRKQENPSTQPLAITSEYSAVKPQLESIYQSLSKSVRQFDIANSDAQLLLL